MALFNLIDINLYAVIILVYILVSTLRRDGLRFFQDKLFIWLIISTMVILLIDAVAWAFDAQPGHLASVGNIASNVLLFALSPIPVAIWFLYSDYQIFQDDKRIKRALWVVGALIAANAFISVLSPIAKLYFSFDANNVFHRGPIEFYFIFILLNIGLLIISAIKLIIHRKKLEKNCFIFLLFFGVPPLVGSLIQILFYGISILWSFVALSVLFVFINIQDNRLNSDPLTGAYNRRQLSLFIRARIRQNNTFAGMMLDLNGFKKINDSLGHAEGDCALADTVRILRQCLRTQDRIFRYGGDEFVVIMEINSDEVLAPIVQRVYAGFDYYNRTSGKPYRLQPSIGYMQYEKSSDMDSDEFINMLDSLMYMEKNEVKTEAVC